MLLEFSLEQLILEKNTGKLSLALMYELGHLSGCLMKKTDRREMLTQLRRAMAVVNAIARVTSIEVLQAQSGGETTDLIAAALRLHRVALDIYQQLNDDSPHKGCLSCYLSEFADCLCGLGEMFAIQAGELNVSSLTEPQS